MSDCSNELKESLEQQTATSEILGVIASSPTDIQPVLDIVVRNGARVCGAVSANVALVKDAVYRIAATKTSGTQSGVGLSRSWIEIRTMDELLWTAKSFTFGISRK